MKTNNIVAIATAHGYSGIGIVRISGKDLLPLASTLVNKQNIPTKQAVYCDCFDNEGNIIDSGLLLYFKAPHSFTGEDVIEFQGHGSPIVLQMIVARCLELGCTMADAGEFSQRAYLNGKIDLVQAESIIDLIHAESEASAKSALKSLKGSFSRHINEVNQQLINLRMFVEASLDFPEEDIEFIMEAKIREKLALLQRDIQKLLANTKQGVLLNNGANIVIIGRPNVGKSSLLNALTNEDIAIVSDIAGTTRDIIKEKIIINGIAFNIIDTAGIRTTDDVVEKIGIERALSAMLNAELCLVLIDSSVGITAEDQSILAQIPESMPRLFVYNKVDLLSDDSYVSKNNEQYISAKTLRGIDDLRAAILRLVGFDSNNHDVFIARTRHLNAMKQAVLHIDYAFANWENLELLAEELRYGHNKLSEITGEFSANDLLGEIFSRFCIGK